MLLESILRKVVVTINDVHNDRPPGDDVAMLGFLVEAGEASNDVRAKTKYFDVIALAVNPSNIHVTSTYGMRAASVSARLAFLSSLSS